MKSVILMSLIFASASAMANSLDGLSYCRTVMSEGHFGQPKGERKHCITFANGLASDNSSTFFGNPPQRKAYAVNGLKVIFGKSSYYLSANKTMLKSENGSAVRGTVFVLENR